MLLKFNDIITLIHRCINLNDKYRKICRLLKYDDSSMPSPQAKHTTTYDILTAFQFEKFFKEEVWPMTLYMIWDEISFITFIDIQYIPVSLSIWLECNTTILRLYQKMGLIGPVPHNISLVIF